MFTMVAEGTRRTISALAAVAVVAFTGLTLEQGHQGALPVGTVEVGELAPVGDSMQLASVALPEIVVTGRRIAPDEARVAVATSPTLPGIVVAAGHAALEASAGATAQSASNPSVLLK